MGGTVRLGTLILLTATSVAQVQVSVSSSKTEYLAGEPIYAILRITNIGQDPVANPGNTSRVDLTVNASPRIVRNLYGCLRGVGGASLSGVDHPPFLMPGKTSEERLLLRNHLLAPGEYSLRVSGDPGVYWKFYGAVRSTGKFQNGDPVPGATFDQTIKLRILPATEAELRAAYAPYIAAIDMEFPSYPSRDAIAEMAPPFLEKTILSFATQPQSAFLAVRGLERIDTAESRTDLAALYKKSYDLHLRVAIVEALARMNSVDQLSFMASLLAGPSSEADDYIHEYAALGIGLAGGDRGADILSQFLRRDGAQVNQRFKVDLAIGLANTKSRRAVPALIDLYGDGDDSVRNTVCDGLMSLTHRSWCDGSAYTPRTQTIWREWWRIHRSTTPIFGVDQCPAIGSSKPIMN